MRNCQYQGLFFDPWPQWGHSVQNKVTRVLHSHPCSTLCPLNIWFRWRYTVWKNEKKNLPNTHLTDKFIMRAASRTTCAIRSVKQCKWAACVWLVCSYRAAIWILQQRLVIVPLGQFACHKYSGSLSVYLHLPDICLTKTRLFISILVH